MRRLILAGTTILLCLFLGACANSGSKNSASEVPDDFSILFGEGGGFTGRWSGHTVNPDGTVTSWAGMSAAENPTAAGQLSDDEVSYLWKKLEAVKFFESGVHESGNMTRLIRVTANGETHEVSWPRSGLTDGGGSTLDELLAYCQEQVSPREKP